MLTACARMCVRSQETKVKAQQSACNDINEWLGHRHKWQSLLGKRVHSFAPSPLPCPRVRGGELTRANARADDDAKLRGEHTFLHPADQLLAECLDLFVKCKDARTGAQQQLPMTMWELPHTIFPCHWQPCL